MNNPKHRGGDTERRRSQRRPTRRAAVFVGLEAPDLLRHGTAVDISLNGLCVETPLPAEKGARVEVELQPREGNPGGLILVRGVVVRVAPRQGGRCAMGIRLAAPAPRCHTWTPRLDTPDTARALLAEVSGQVRGMRADAPSPVAVLEDARASGNRAPGARNSIRQRRRRALAVLALLLVIGLLLGGTVRAPGILRAEGGTWSAGPGYRIIGEDHAGPGTLLTEGGRIPSLNTRTDSDTRSGHTARPYQSPQPPRHAGQTEALLGRAQGHLAQGRPDDALNAFRHVREAPGIQPVEQFLARFGEAQALEQLGNNDAALRTMHAALGTGEGVPRAWQHAALDYARALDRADTPALRAAALDHPMPLAQTAAAPPPLPEHEGIAVVISKRDYLLTVFRDGVPLRSFPVGLGRDGTTPTGTFHIANKLTDPDWYNRGETVPAGDPRNPLGRRWMGLGNETGPTPYGIHPTDEAESIGGNESRGCIRMRPADAETLFRLCPSGTVVHIAP